MLFPIRHRAHTALCRSAPSRHRYRSSRIICSTFGPRADIRVLDSVPCASRLQPTRKCTKGTGVRSAARAPFDCGGFGGRGQGTGSTPWSFLPRVGAPATPHRTAQYRHCQLANFFSHLPACTWVFYSTHTMVRSRHPPCKGGMRVVNGTGCRRMSGPYPPLSPPNSHGHAHPIRRIMRDTLGGIDGCAPTNNPNTAPVHESTMSNAGNNLAQADSPSGAASRTRPLALIVPARAHMRALGRDVMCDRHRDSSHPVTSFPRPPARYAYVHAHRPERHDR